MYREPNAWGRLLDKLVKVLREFARQQVEAGADVIQIFDSWAGALSVEDYRDFVLPATKGLVRDVQAMGVPVIYFGVDTASLLPSMHETGADVLGLDWRIPLSLAPSRSVALALMLDYSDTLTRDAWWFVPNVAGFTLEVTTATSAAPPAWTLIVVKEYWRGADGADLKMMQWAQVERGSRAHVVAWLQRQETRLGG